MLFGQRQRRIGVEARHVVIGDDQVPILLVQRGQHPGCRVHPSHQGPVAATSELADYQQCVVFRVLGNRGKLTEKDIDEALRQVRLALLEADVNYMVVKDLEGNIKEKALDQKVLDSLTPAQQVIKIVRDQLTWS